MAEEEYQSDQDSYVYEDEDLLSGDYPGRPEGTAGAVMGDWVSRHRRLFSFITFAILGYVGLHVWHAFRHHDASKTPATKTVSAKLPAISSHKASLKAQPKKASGMQNITQSVISTAPDALNEQLKSLRKMQETEYQQLHADIMKLHQSMEQTRASLNTFNQSISQLTEEVSKRLNTLDASEARRMTALQAAAEQHYKVTAIIPGRAWLVGPEDALLTVDVGSRIPTVGIVTHIDASAGRVETNTGAVLRFAHAER